MIVVVGTFRTYYIILSNVLVKEEEEVSLFLVLAPNNIAEAELNV